MNLQKLFYPRSLAVIGASNTPGKLGYNVLKNLIDHGFEGKIFPVNPKGGLVQGIQAYRSVSDIGDEIDAAVTIVPAAITPKVVQECFSRGIEFVTIEAAGFGELGAKGKQIEQKLNNLVNEYNCHILGPNCSGIINVNNGLCQPIGLVGDLRLGNVGLIAQAGVYASGILWGLRNIMDFSMIATIGNKIDIDETDVLEFMGKDPSIKVIAMYLEDIRRGERFLEVARDIPSHKPIIVLKGGRTEEGKAKAVTHTAAIGGSRQSYEAVFEEAGIIQARDNDHLFDMVRGFSKQPLPSTDRMMVISYSGSQGITATDALSEMGAGLADLSKVTKQSMKEHIPDLVAAINPADLTFDQNPEQVRKIIEIAARDENVGGIIANLQPEMLDGYVDEMKDLDSDGKPVVFSITGKEFAMDGVIGLEALGFPVYSTPERASEVLAIMHRHSINNIKPRDLKVFQVDRGKVSRVLTAARKMGMVTVGGFGAFQILKAYGIPVAECYMARTPEEAEELCSSLEGPLVFKIESSRVLHKSDLGGVELGVTGDFGSIFSGIIERVMTRCPYLTRKDIDGILIQPMLKGGKEVLIGCTYEQALGCHIIKFGLGGKYTEIFGDVSNGVVPLDEMRAKRMVRDTKYIGRLLEGQRGEDPYDIQGVEDALMRFSQLVMDFPEIREIEANPFVVWHSGGIVIDARFALTAHETESLVCEDSETVKEAI
jgi:acyl-CoA synthetase (NDP forming)